MWRVQHVAFRARSERFGLTERGEVDGPARAWSLVDPPEGSWKSAVFCRQVALLFPVATIISRNKSERQGASGISDPNLRKPPRSQAGLLNDRAIFEHGPG